MRTTIEIKDEYRAKLLELAARRGEKGFSSIIEEAIQQYLEAESENVEARRRALKLRGCLSGDEAKRLDRETRVIRESWR